MTSRHNCAVFHNPDAVDPRSSEIYLVVVLLLSGETVSISTSLRTSFLGCRTAGPLKNSMDCERNKQSNTSASRNMMKYILQKTESFGICERISTIRS